MQLGTRWAAGADAPASVPAALLPAIAEVESRGVEGYWTLTWLEGRPIAELDAGWEVLQDAAGEVIAREFQD
ncbi:MULTISPECIES: hypothetical protein [unclassified Microbacterium]|uniref:hypothetical protein n=1 Tax=unclassified Microbacterium TaxID=2609290 RepID=UPI001E051E16|nr:MULTISPECIES: hypothetical protein [unclassified Microbacterium]CAH0165848.1 hypothetical protein SRABI121_01622 [Microbacterium sp. Bi121]HWK78806.1 hypothetical protein [Microbacterium sp.]